MSNVTTKYDNILRENNFYSFKIQNGLSVEYVAYSDTTYYSDIT